MWNNTLSTYQRGGILTIVFLLIHLMVTPASADLFRVTIQSSFDDIPSSGIFGVTNPVDITATLLIETGVTPVLSISQGTLTPEGWYADTDIYGYDVQAISDVSCTFGNKVWDIHDVLLPYYWTDTIIQPDPGLGLLVDTPLVDGTVPLVLFQLTDDDGFIIFQQYGTNGNVTFGFRNSWLSVAHEYGPETEINTKKGFVTVDVVPAPIPEPTTMLLLGTGLIGLVRLRRRFKK